MPGDKFIILKIEREFVDILCEENPEPKNVRMENGIKVIPTITEIILCMYVVHTTMVLPVQKNVEIPWTHYQY